MARIITVCNQKGGVGKTTTAINVCSFLASAGKSVLLVDLDGQANASSGIGIRLTENEFSTYDLLKQNSLTAKDVIRRTPYNIDIIPSHINLSGIDLEINSYLGREEILKRKLDGITAKYDFIIIDTAPSLSLLTVNALTVSNEVIITVENNPLALDGLKKLFETINSIRDIFNPGLSVSGIVITMYDSRTKLGQAVIDKLMSDENTKSIVYKTYVRRNVKLAEAIDTGKPINHYETDCNGFTDYRDLTNEILTSKTNL